MESAKRSALLRFLDYAKPYTFLTVLMTIFGVFKFQLPLVIPWALKEIVDKVLLSSLPVAQKIGRIDKYVYVLLGILAVYSIVVYFRHYLHGIISNRVIFDLRYKLFEHIQKMSLSFFERRKIGQIVSYVINDINVAALFVGNAVVNTVIDFATIITISVILIKMNQNLMLVSIALIPIYMFALMRFKPKIKSTSKAAQKKLAVLSGELHEKFSGMKAIQSFNREKTESLRFFHENREYYDLVLESSKINAQSLTISHVFAVIAPVLVIWYGSYLVVNGKISVGELLAFYAYLAALYQPLSRLAELNMIMQNSIASMERIFEIFDEKIEIIEKPEAVPHIIEKADIEFKDVNFEYAPGKRALKNIELKVKHGQTIALVGPSGAGKTTLVNLLLRFYDTSSGSIIIDGVEIKDYKIKVLRDQIGIVTQEPILFAGTVKENIRYGNIFATIEEVVEAAKAANAHDFIVEIPKQYSSEIGEKGTMLSGGQKQRISLARVFLKNPKIIILDEATSALDSISENLIQESLDRLLKGRTTFVIAHRLSTVLNADMIVVFNRGRIVQAGPHSELIKQKGQIYEHLYNEQFDIKEDE